VDRTTIEQEAATPCGSPFSWVEGHLARRTRSERYARVVLEGEYLPQPAGAGQFVLARYGEDPCLPRAFSVMSAREGALEFFVKSEGRVREKLSSAPIGTPFQVRGPYGVPYASLIASGRRYVLVAGGSGVAPMLCFAGAFPERVEVSVFGFRTADACDLLPDVPLVIEEVTGQRATDRLRSVWRPGLGILACGPEPMLRILAREYGGQPDVYVSLEARIGCGIGTCLGCRVETTAGPKRICVDGPLFPMEELPWLT
jgi:dihydroorotate dehydrogenase electron transfer subunit